MAAVRSRQVTHVFNRSVALYTLPDRLGTRVEQRRTIPRDTSVEISLERQELEYGGVKCIYYPCSAQIAGATVEGLLHEDDIPCQVFVIR